MVNISHPNLGKLFDCLRMETEKTLKNILKLKNLDYFSVRGDLVKQAKIHVVTENEDLYLIDELFNIFDDIIGWKADNKIF